MSIQEEFEAASNNQQFKFNKLDLMKDYDGSYLDSITRLAFTYFLAGYSCAMPPVYIGSKP
jgi:hypothetical protein